jgi:hypothetical protein
VKFLTLSLFVLFLSTHPASAQRRNNWPQPPETADKSSTATATSTSAVPTTHADPAQLEREAREILELAQSLQADIQRVNRGILPKDTIAKLKRIEKLSKQLRGQLGP